MLISCPRPRARYTTSIAVVVAFAFVILSAPSAFASNPPSTPPWVDSEYSNNTSAYIYWGASTDDVAVTGYEVSLNGVVVFPNQSATWAAVPWSYNCANTYVFSVRARDADSNFSGSASFVIAASCSDTTPPTIPTGLSVTSISASTATVSWNASTDNAAVLRYELSVNGSTYLVTHPTTSRSISGLSCGGTYPVSVRARDVNNNLSSAANSSFSTPACPPPSPIPTTPPWVDSEYSTSTFAHIYWGPSTDDVGVTGYEVSLNGVVAFANQVERWALVPWSYNCANTYVFSVRARDASANFSGSASFVLPASCSDSTPPTMPTGLGATSITTSSATLSWNLSTDNVAVDRYELTVNGITHTITHPTVSKSITGLSCGTTYPITVRARDTSYNWSAIASASFSTPTCAPPDTTPPTAPSGFTTTTTSSTSVTVTWNASLDVGGLSGYGVYLNSLNAGFVPHPSRSTVLTVKCGVVYELTVVAQDLAQNKSSSIFRFPAPACPVDTESPTAPSGLTILGRTKTTIEFGWNASVDNDQVAGYDIRRNGVWVDWELGHAREHRLTGLVCGTSYSIQVIAKDRVSPTPNYGASAQLAATTTSCGGDTAPPTPPTNVQASAVTATGATLSWSASTDNVGVSSYEIRRSGVREAITSSTSRQVALTCETASSFTLVALDAAGNAASSAPVSVTGSTCPTGKVPTGFALSGEQLVFSDEFNDSVIDQSKWDTLRGQPGGQYGSPYNVDIEDAVYRSANTTEAGGNAELTLKNESFSGFPYTSGVLLSGNHFSYKFGFVEARIKVPKCSGCWPAFWLLDAPVDDHWPPEIDIVEMFNTQTNPRPQFNYHWVESGAHAQLSEMRYGKNFVDYASDFHTYGLHWTPSFMKVYLDGQLEITYWNRGNQTQLAQYIIFNLALQKGHQPPTNQKMLIDYVRVWRFPSGIAP